MNKQTEPVDVLAVMDRQIDIDRDVLAAMSNKDARWVYEGPLENFIAARAAIAELIESASAYRATICTYKASWQSHDAFLQRRLDAALAAVEGAK